MADKAYSSAANRAYLRKRGITAVIPVKEDQKKHRRARGRAGGRPPAFDPARYKERNTVERCFSKLKQFRAVATRYDKRDYMSRPPSTSPRSGSGYETPFLIYGTRLVPDRPAEARPLAIGTATALGYSWAFAGARRPVPVVHDGPIVSLSVAGGRLDEPDPIRSPRR